LITDTNTYFSRSVLRQTGFRLLPGLVFVIVLVVVWVIHLEMLAAAKQNLHAHFEDDAQEIADSIEQRGQRYDRILRSVSGLFPPQLKLTDNRAFADYVRALDIQSEYPGISAMGMAVVSKQQGETGFTTAIVHIAPDAPRNLKLLGVDPYAESLRQNAMLSSLASNKPAMTNQLSGLLPEAERARGAIFDMYMPLFQPNLLSDDSVEWRRTHILGWAFFSFHVADFIAGLGPSRESGLALDIFDGEVVPANQVLFYSNDSMNRELRSRVALFNMTKHVKISGHAWTVNVRSLPAYELGLDSAPADRLLRNGFLLSLLMALIAWLWVNAHKRAQEIANKLTVDMQKLVRAVGQSPVATVITDTNGRIEFVSTRFVEISGYTSEELIGRRTTLFKSGLTPQYVYQDLWETIKAGQVWRGTLQNKKKNGTIYWESQVISSLKNEKGEVVSFIAAKEDITERKRAQEALVKSEAFNLAIMDSITDEIVVLDRNGRIIASNQAWRRQALQNGSERGKPAPHTNIGARFESFCKVGDVFSLEEDALNASDGIKAVLDGSLDHFMLEYACHSTTQPRWSSLRASPLVPHGQGAVITQSNITDRKNIEAAFFTYQEDLEVRVDQRTHQLRALGMELLKAETRERRTIAEDLHDDLGQILAVAKLKLSSVQMPGCDEEREVCQRQLNEIETMIDHSSKSVRSLSTQLSPPALYQSGLSGALEWLTEEMMRNYGLRVTLELDDILPLDEAVSSALFRTVRELLINIWKHSQVSDACVTLTLESISNTLIIGVIDDGVGFEVVQMLKPSAKHSYGLFSIRERLTFIGGSMRIDSEPGQGTRITLRVPLAHFNK